MEPSLIAELIALGLDSDVDTDTRIEAIQASLIATPALPPAEARIAERLRYGVGNAQGALSRLRCPAERWQEWSRRWPKAPERPQASVAQNLPVRRPAAHGTPADRAANPCRAHYFPAGTAAPVFNLAVKVDYPLRAVHTRRDRHLTSQLRFAIRELPDDLVGCPAAAIVLSVAHGVGVFDTLVPSGTTMRTGLTLTADLPPYEKEQTPVLASEIELWIFAPGARVLDAALPKA